MLNIPLFLVNVKGEVKVFLCPPHPSNPSLMVSLGLSKAAVSTARSQAYVLGDPPEGAQIQGQAPPGP